MLTCITQREQTFTLSMTKEFYATQLTHQVLFSERQRLNALRAQMIYLQTELAAAQNSGILTFDDAEKTGYQPYGYHYKSPSLSESLKYFQNPSVKLIKGVGPYVNNEAPPATNDMPARKNPFSMLTSNVPVETS